MDILKRLYKDKESMDIDIYIDSSDDNPNEPIKCHSLIVKMESDYFKALIESNFVESTTKRIDIKEVDIESMKLFIDTIYLGDTIINLDNISILNTLADRFIASDIKSKIIQKVNDFDKSDKLEINKDNFELIYNISQTTNNKSIEKKCFDYVKKDINFDNVDYYNTIHVNNFGLPVDIIQHAYKNHKSYSLSDIEDYIINDSYDLLDCDEKIDSCYEIMKDINFSVKTKDILSISIKLYNCNESNKLNTLFYNHVFIKIFIYNVINGIENKPEHTKKYRVSLCSILSIEDKAKVFDMLIPMLKRVELRDTPFTFDN
jgi:hypothetical protein